MTGWPGTIASAGFATRSGIAPADAAPIRNLATRAAAQRRRQRLPRHSRPWRLRSRAARGSALDTQPGIGTGDLFEGNVSGGLPVRCQEVAQERPQGGLTLEPVRQFGARGVEQRRSGPPHARQARRDESLSEYNSSLSNASKSCSINWNQFSLALPPLDVYWQMHPPQGLGSHPSFMHWRRDGGGGGGGPPGQPVGSGTPWGTGATHCSGNVPPAQARKS
jgi:hypothetical protein